MISRRRYLGGFVAAGATSLAGCVVGQAEPDSPIASYALAPGEYRAIVVFRNDDTRPDHRLDTLQAVERAFVEAGIPLTDGVIPAFEAPFTPDHELSRHLRRRAREYPGYFELAMHGYSHAEETTFHGGVSEFGDLPRSVQREKLASGRAMLADCLDVEATTFIPPFNTYDEVTVEEAARAGFEVLSGGSWFTDSYYPGEEMPMARGGVLHVPSTANFVDDWETVELVPLETMVARFDEAVETTGLHVQLLHYQHFADAEALAQLRAFLGHAAAADGVGFLTLGAFAEAYRDGSLTRDDGVWTYAPERRA